MNEGTIALMIPYGAFLLVGTCVWLILANRAAAHRETQQTVRLALEKGGELTPEAIQRICAGNTHPQKDVRRGIAWIAIAVGLALMGLLAPDPSGNAVLGMMAIAAIPLAIGIGYLVMYRIAQPNAA
ncbi:DUF6249 domain-containing protein [Microbulbifer hydrolyticus]|uniref:DUF6249 domain-containing protein n=1 Tax=Microbulbifer hydrolyticus TaxID=48074 RepID=A0A6P1TF47_9GAMM|nr:DUF6249 domain-containing protein [Microbulbifer hydrolyticus]MBB5212691.1 hypothetical protein [Microbulbifer hydrolyticus]QHQ40286.1 hypothetical protein GTQ55_15750 [Microbulbifer hydrolyticus]